jgi:hypothetical protein
LQRVRRAVLFVFCDGFSSVVFLNSDLIFLKDSFFFQECF